MCKFLLIVLTCILGSVLKLDKYTAASYIKLNNEPESDTDNGLKACTICQDMLERLVKLNKVKVC